MNAPINFFKKIKANYRKVDSLMTFLHGLSEDYLNGKSIVMKNETFINNEDTQFLIDEMEKFHNYLSTNALTFSYMQKTVDLARKNRNALFAKKIEPQLFYYNEIARSALSKLDDVDPSKNKKWSPDYLFVCLIIDAKENGMELENYPFINNYDFSKHLEIYREAAIKMKKMYLEENIMNDKNITILKRMENLSITVVERLNKVKYKAGRKR